MTPSQLQLLQQLQAQVASLVSASQNKQQLTNPLDPVSKTVIKAQILFPITFNAAGAAAQTSANYSIFFQADRSIGILSVVEVHAVASGATATLQLEKLTGTTAPGSGTALLTTAFNLNGTANTPQYGAITASAGKNSLVRGDRLAAKVSGTLTSSVDVVMTVFLQPL
jgi:hypothetical protein